MTPDAGVHGSGPPPEIPRCSATLASIVVYPLKSAGGVALARAHIASHGLELDRQWMLIDREGEFVSQRTVPRMALIRVEIGADRLTVRAPGMPDLRVDVEPESGEALRTRIWSDVCTGLAVDPRADAWLSRFLHRSVRLVYLPQVSLRTSGSG